MPERRGGRGGYRSRPWQTGMREAGPYLGLGLQFAGGMALFTFGGYLLDRWLGTSPWLLIGGAVVGMVAVMAQLVRVSQTLAPKPGAKRGIGRAAGAGRAGFPADSARPLETGAVPRAGDPTLGPASPIGDPEYGPSSPATGRAGFEEVEGERLADLERRFAGRGEVRDGVLLLSAWEAQDFIEEARKGYIPVHAVEAFVPTGAGMRPVDTFRVTYEERSRHGWDEASRFVEDLRESELRFHVVLARPL